MTMKREASIDDSYSDIPSIPITTIGIHNFHHSNLNIQAQNLTEIQSNFQPNSRANKKSVKITPKSSGESHTSSGSGSTFKPRSSTLNGTQRDKFHQRIKEQYEGLEISEASYRFYITEQSSVRRAREELERSPDGTYFVRKAELNEENSNVKYFLNFVCHKRVAEVPICCDEHRRTFWFLSSYGHGSEVRRVYTGIDVLIRHKKENIFYELQYPFQICLYQPINTGEKNMFIPLPDEVRAMTGQNNFLHELATQGLTHYFNELIRLSTDDGNPLKEKAIFIVNKINGRNKQGQTPLILAIQSKRYDFIDILLDNEVNVNVTDIDGCSPLHHACRQADPKILKKLIVRGADPHYVNQRETADGICRSNLSAFHYLAMAKGAAAKNIERCATHLTEKGCSLMSLTSNGKTPFDVAEIFDNKAYECVKFFCRKCDFNQLTPIEVSSRSEAKTILSDLACPSMLGKIRLRIKQYDNRDCCGNNGLFLFYKARKSPNQSDGEFGLCVYHNNQVYVYPISQKHIRNIQDPTDLTRNIVYKVSLITDTVKDDQSQVVLFRSCEELIYNHTKHKGILPTVLKEFVQKGYNGETKTMKADTLLVPNKQVNNITVYDNADEQTDLNEEPIETNIPVDTIDRFFICQITSLKPIHENSRRIIWFAKVRINPTISFPIIIKDYLPIKDIESYKQNRYNEINNSSNDSNYIFSDDINYISNNEYPYEFSSRTYLEYKHESQILLDKLKNHPFIVHTFSCDINPQRDLRIFMEYLPLGNLQSYLTKLDKTSLEPFIHAFHWIYQLAQVMGYLSKKKIVHQDLASRNILLYNETHIKLSDFGLSRPEGLLPEGRDFFLSPRWTAPEYLDHHQKISSLSDVWSFGVVIWEIYSFGAVPYENEIKPSKDTLVPLLKRYLIEQSRRLTRPSDCSPSIYDLICRCLNVNKDKRPCFVDIINELNGTSRSKDCMEPFTREEKTAWKKAQNNYLTIIKENSIPIPPDTEYIEVIDEKENNEINDDEPIVIKL